MTITPTATYTPTITPTSTETPTITPTFTHTPPYNMPGLYYLYKCVDYVPEDIPITINFCVQSVKVNADLTMQFNVYWRTYIETYNYLIKRSIEFDKNFYITDDLGNKYDATDWRKSAGVCHVSTRSDCRMVFISGRKTRGDVIYILGPVQYDLHRRHRPAGCEPDPDPDDHPDTHAWNLYNAPGTYYFYRCDAYQPGGRLAGAEKVELCLVSVLIHEDRTMRFNLTWKVFASKSVLKESDANNPNIIFAG